MKKFIIVAISFLSFLLGCEGPAGPVGAPGENAIGTLTDPKVQPKVIYTNPPANSIGPYSDFTGTFTIRFNKIMDPASVRNAVVLSSTHFIEADTTSFRATGGDVYTFIAVDSLHQSYTNRWIVGMACTLKVLSTVKDINGNSLRSPFVMTFAPEPFFQVKTVYPSHSSTNVSTSSSLYIIFNSSVDTSIIPLIHISPPIEGYWTFSYYYGDSMQIAFNKLNPFDPDTTYSINIDSSAIDKHGNKLHGGFSSTFHTEPLRITSVYPQDGSTNVSINQYIYIYFNGSIDSSSVKEAFTLTPSVTGNFKFYNSEFIFMPSSNYGDSTTYTVTISQDLKSPYGKQLAAPYTFSFKTQ